ncbi:hypothetical protein B0H13DRAFT_1916816 [Mycena leptocephala]|nr:hypothetical protein B0H13DRAFT_1916816 [Mycena leptocephala]
MLLQLALLQFTLAISVYLWPIHRLIAAIALALTLVGFASYIFLLVSAIVSPDSPFQTPFASFLGRVVSQIWQPLKPIFDTVSEFAEDVRSSISQFVKSRTYILPSFKSQTSSNPELPLWELAPDAYFSKTSAKLSTVIQIYRKSSDADPGDLMSSDKWAFHTFPSLAHRHITSGQKGLEHFLDTLHVDQIVGLDESTFTDYLCCIDSFLGPMDPRIVVEVDKSHLRLPLMVQLFKVLQRPNTDISLATKIMSTTGLLMNKSAITATTQWQDIKDLMTEISHSAVLSLLGTITSGLGICCHTCQD